jgi:hypothetical protein
VFSRGTGMACVVSHSSTVRLLTASGALVPANSAGT